MSNQLWKKIRIFWDWFKYMVKYMSQIVRKVDEIKNNCARVLKTIGFKKKMECIQIADYVYDWWCNRYLLMNYGKGIALIIQIDINIYITNC